jgi:hypothetical protein
MRPQKITFGKLRSDGGPTSILVYCSDYRRSHLGGCAAQGHGRQMKSAHRRRFRGHKEVSKE